MKNADSPVISIVLSFRNEADNIDELIARITAAFEDQPEDFELVFVNDDSTDSSEEMLVAHNKRDPRVKLVNMSRRFGVSECVMAGFRHATGDAVIYMDTDLQDPPEVIPDLLAKWRDGAELVYTVRRKREGERPFRMLMTRWAYRFIGSVSEIDLPVEAGDFRLVDRKIVDELVKLPEKTPYIRGLSNWVGFRQEKVEYIRQPRSGGETHFPGTFSLAALREFMKGVTSFSFAPLYVFMVIGGVSAVGALAGTVIALVLQFAGGGWSPWFYMGTFILFLWGVLMGALGVIGIYLGRIYSDVRGRPLYIVRDTVGFDGRRR